MKYRSQLEIELIVKMSLYNGLVIFVTSVVKRPKDLSNMNKNIFIDHYCSISYTADDSFRRYI